MREIKFKAQRIDGKGWVYGSLVNTENGQCYIFNYYFIPAKSVPSEKFIEVIPETVCQFTGLKDKNGKYIYEGDVFMFSNSIINVVIFNQGCFGYDSFRESDFDDINFVELSNYHFKYNENLEGQRIEVIGNIHDKN